MTIIGEPRHWHDKFKFRLEIDDLGSAAFANCSELKADVAKIEYYEGGSLIPFKEPGRMNFADITIERAATTDADLYSWLQITADASRNAGLLSPKFKKNGQIVQLDRDNSRIRIWGLTGLWPTSVTVGSWDNDSDEFTMEQAVLAVDYFYMIKNSGPGSGFLGTLRAAAHASVRTK
jgi:phage tail-like protein